jgi:hypothetical protein
MAAHVARQTGGSAPDHDAGTARRTCISRRLSAPGHRRRLRVRAVWDMRALGRNFRWERTIRLAACHARRHMRADRRTSDMGRMGRTRGPAGRKWRAGRDMGWTRRNMGARRPAGRVACNGAGRHMSRTRRLKGAVDAAAHARTRSPMRTYRRASHVARRRAGRHMCRTRR